MLTDYRVLLRKPGRLAVLLNEHVKETDVLRQAIDGHLTLSVWFAAPAEIQPAPKSSFDRAETIEGLWDLVMAGTGKLEIERRFHELSNGPNISIKQSEGAWVVMDGVRHELIAERILGKGCFLDWHYRPLPAHSALVVRTESSREG